MAKSESPKSTSCCSALGNPPLTDPVSTPRIVDLSETRKALYAIERRDGRGFVTWEEHTQKADFGKPGIQMLLLWTDEDKAWRYAEEELRNTGKPCRIKRPAVLPFLRKMLAANVEWVWFNRLPLNVAETETGTHGMAKTCDLIRYLEGGGRIAGIRRS